MGFTIVGLLSALRLREVGVDQYEADHVDTGHTVVFGGQLLAQSIAAACRGHEDKTIKTLHTVFARAGSPQRPVEIAVDRMHNGRALASCTVTIRQGERLCARSMVLLTSDEPDFIRHTDQYESSLLPPETLRRTSPDTGWDVHIAEGADIRDPQATGPAELDVWTRFRGAPADPMLAQAMLAYASDGYLIGAAMRPHHGVGQDLAHKTISTGVLSHTITFHEPWPPDEWLLMSHRSPYAGRGRSYGRADVFSEAGRLVASFVQDSMIRPMSNGSPGL